MQFELTLSAAYYKSKAIVQVQLQPLRLLLESHISRLNVCVILVQNKSQAPPSSLFLELLTEKGYEAEGVTEMYIYIYKYIILYKYFLVK